MPRPLLAWLSVCLLAGGVLADEFRGYPEFRYISGLPGGGNGVAANGSLGFHGALQMNIPVGYTPGAGNYILGGYTSAIKGGLPTSFSGSEVNGTALLGMGFTWQGRGIWLGDMETGRKGESAYNLQVQLWPAQDDRPAISLGVVDLFGRRTSDLLHPEYTDSRSFFAAATWEREYQDHPYWLTLGLGSGRFNDRLFGGVSYQAAERLKVLAEYDGWNVNVGAAYDLNGGWQDGEWHAILLAGLTDLDRATIGLTITRGSVGH